jgi:hypothetical protein
MSIRLPLVMIVTVLAAGAGYAMSKWMDRPAAAAPVTTGATLDRDAPAPRDASGRPDLSGVWQAESLPREEAMKILPDGVDGAQTLGEDRPGKQFLNVAWDLKPDEVAMAPHAAAIFQQRGASASRDLPSSFCLPLGVPLMDAALFPHRIVQTPALVAILYEEGTMFRQIFTDGRSLPADPEPAFLGHSIGRWDGDVLVVEAIGFRDNGWLDASGHPHSSAMRLTERFHRRNVGTMEVSVTVDDSKNYNKPFTYSFIQRLMADNVMFESVCENEKDRVRLDAQ